MADRSDEELLESLHAQLDVECKIKDGAENLLQVFSQGIPGSNGSLSNGQQSTSNGREQLRKQVQEELAAADTKIAKLRSQIDTLIQQINSQVASTSRAHLETSSPTALGLHPTGRPSPLRFGSRKLEETSINRGETDVFAIKSHALALMQALQSLAPVAPSRVRAPSSRPSSAGGRVTSNGDSPMGPPVTPSMTRSAQRARATALANSKGVHTRTPSHAAGLGDIPKRRIDIMSRLVEVMEKSARLRYELPVEELIACAFPCLADQAGKEVRASAYRLLRHAMVRPPWNLVRTCRQAGLDLYLARSFLRDSRFDLEKEQGLKLVRTIMECGSSNTREEDLISVSVIRALVAAADQAEEKLRHVYIETLAELAIHDTSLLIRGGGLRSVLQTLSDGPYELAPAMMSLLLTCVDLPGTRKYFRPGYDLEVALSSLTEAREDEESLQSTAQVVSIMLRSWTGLFYLSLYNHRAIRSLVLALRVNSIEVQEKILDLLCGLLNIKTRSERAKIITSNQRFKPHPRLNKSCRLNLYDHYLALIALILIECGITEAIVHVLETKSELARKTTLLMGHLTQIANKHLPSEYGVRMQALPDVFSAFFDRSTEKRKTGERANGQEKAALVLSTIDDFGREQARNRTLLHDNANRDRSNSTITNVRSTSQFDETAFRTLLLDSNVLNTKEYSKWNIDSIMHIFEAIQSQPKRLEETVRLGKIIRRVLAFYHPFSLQYATIANTSKSSQRYTKLGCIVFQTLASSTDGQRILLEDKVLKEIRESLSTDLMTSQRTQDTLIVGYFEILGVLTKTEEGRQLMHKSRLFTALYRAIEDSGNEEMIKAIMMHFDFSIEGHCRVLLSKILTSSRPKMRLYATQIIADMISVNASRWLVSLLVTQLYDAGAAIRELASNLLLEVCSSSTKALEMIVSLRPILEETSHSLLLKFISTSVGLRYLLQGDYVDREMDEWFNKRNSLYAVQLEVLLARGFSIDRDRDDQDLQWDGCLPPHFYGELAKTSEGCDVLQQKGHFAEFAHFIRTHGMEEEDVEVINKVKSVLWAVGNIGTTEGGLAFLEEEDLISSIVNIAEQSQVFSLRGTCYFVLGLISTTQQGAELVEDQGWLTSAFDANVYCIPSPVFLQVEPWKPTLPYTSVAVLEPETRIERTIMLNISNLGNSILANKASRTLSKLKQKHRRLFVKKGVELFVRSLFIVHYHYIRQAVRRFIWELFEIKLDQECVDEILEYRRRLLSGKRPELNLALVAEGSAYDIELRRHGDEVLGAGLEHENDEMDEEIGDYTDEDEEEEEDSMLLEEDYEVEPGEEQSGLSYSHQPLDHFHQAPVKLRGSQKDTPNLDHHHGPSLAPRRKVVGGFTRPESMILSQSFQIAG